MMVFECKSRNNNKLIALLVLVIVLLCLEPLAPVSAFHLPKLFSAPTRKFRSIRSTSALGNVVRQPRRNLKKKKGSRTTAAEEDFPWDTAEKRPFISSKAIEKGEDYWIDGRDLEKEEARQQAVKNRLAMEGEIPKKKLQQEIVAPYKQNWIGLISVAIVVIATIISQNPELFESPLIPIPDL
mmetsp:Transcript_6416/g.9373  ORF Transcript_6416/g.9373 Transcript_6416/m.9373 type:complete len:183 (+) Transcript_6416:44-592(+)